MMNESMNASDCGTEDREAAQGGEFFAPCYRDRSLVGECGKDAAELFLKRSGYRVLERDWDCGCGSVDIIAEEEGRLAFIEVKTSFATQSFLEESITPQKRQKYERIALQYLKDGYGGGDVRFCFDVIAISIIDRTRAAIRHHINAWGCDA